jgi:hypothetical protein
MPAGVSAYTALANVTLGSTATSVTFSSINTSLYRDLVLVSNVRTTVNARIYFQFNNDSNNHSQVSAEGNGSSTYSAVGGLTDSIYAANGWDGIFANEPTTFVMNVMDYSATDKHKTVLLRGGSAGGSTSVAQGMHAGRYASTSTITSIKISGATWQVGSTFALYGVSQ